jgi:hypothetical protein
MSQRRKLRLQNGVANVGTWSARQKGRAAAPDQLKAFSVGDANVGFR